MVLLVHTHALTHWLHWRLTFAVIPAAGHCKSSLFLVIIKGSSPKTTGSSFWSFGMLLRLLCFRCAFKDKRRSDSHNSPPAQPSYRKKREDVRKVCGDGQKLSRKAIRHWLSFSSPASAGPNPLSTLTSGSRQLSPAMQRSNYLLFLRALICAICLSFSWEAKKKNNKSPAVGHRIGGTRSSTPATTNSVPDESCRSPADRFNRRKKYAHMSNLSPHPSTCQLDSS